VTNPELYLDKQDTLMVRVDRPGIAAVSNKIEDPRSFIMAIAALTGLHVTVNVETVNEGESSGDEEDA